MAPLLLLDTPSQVPLLEEGCPGAEGYMWAGNAGLQGRGWQIEAPVSECSLGASCWPPRLWLSAPALWTPNRPFRHMMVMLVFVPLLFWLRPLGSLVSFSILGAA